MAKYIVYSLVLGVLIFYSCKSDNPVTPASSGNYNKIYTTESGNTKFELWSATSSSLASGYNDIGFKVYISGQKMTSGFVKFFPKMYHHFSGSPWHSTPCSPVYNYNSGKDLFEGYASFIMWTDTSNDWFGWFNYNDVNNIDSAVFPVQYNSQGQMKQFVDNTTETSVLMTLVSPLNARQGLNDFQLLVHRTDNDVTYWEADSLEMYIRTWMNSHGHGSSDNVNPLGLGSGMYKGKVNFSMPGEWWVYDSIKYNNTFITPANTPKLIFDAQ
jgi:YtkA-like